MTIGLQTKLNPACWLLRLVYVESRQGHSTGTWAGTQNNVRLSDHNGVYIDFEP